ncbi:MAG: sigma-70 family RNA polymerase sigma factor [Erysipelotrichaceae bacterium]|nr:sigma-70 family RNA polymerase sigma factor [Erysipelotrichaceae bacterium]
MEDLQIVELYWNRDEKAIEQSQQKYGNYCYSIAYNILHNSEDAQESLNDTWLAAWDAIPPHHPQILSTFLGKITRRLSLNKWRSMTAEKRGGGNFPLSLDELEECIPDQRSIDDRLETQYLSEAIDRFLAKLKEGERKVFVCRYWYFDSVKDIAERFGFSESKVKMLLKRTRDRLKEYLIKEGLVNENRQTA